MGVKAGPAAAIELTPTNEWLNEKECLVGTNYCCTTKFSLQKLPHFSLALANNVTKTTAFQNEMYSIVLKRR